MKDSCVLIAEDEGLIAEELRERLEQLGFVVAGVVASGEEAITFARHTQPDLILMDIRLKGRVDGIEAAAEIRQDLDIPVIYLTAHSDDATISRAKRTEPVGYLIKPFAEQELRVTIELGLHKHDAQRRLRESEQRYATTLTSIGDAVIATDAEGRITFMNPVAQALTRWRREDASGLPLDTVIRLIDATTHAALESPVAKALRDGTVATLGNGVHLVVKDGAEIPIDDSAAPIRDAQDRIRGAVLVFRDISRRLRAEESLRKTEAQLRQAQKLEAIGRLAGGVAHDLNNLMTVVLGCGEMLLEELAPEDPHRRLVTEMKDAGSRATALVRQLLAFGRQQVLVPAVIDLNELISGTVQMIRRVIGAQITVLTNPDHTIGRVRVDRGQMEQVIVNLAINARDAMPEGGVLTFKTRRAVLDAGHWEEAPDVQPGRYTMLSILDTGSGMDSETRAHIFEPFFTTKPTGEGTGLGLATVYGIVKQSGGYIYVDSEPLRGTTFRIYLPEVDDPATAIAAPESSRLIPGTGTILLVEDNDGVRALARWILQKAGYTVLEAEDGEAALRLYEHHPGIDLLLTDAIMPHVGGRALVKRFAAAQPKLKVMLMSGYTADEILRHDVQGLKVPFLRKPFSPRELTLAVHRVLGR
jgi:two-component system cell cycle sensor histidine kinase/response regulator CckA